jgi:putative tricarboxylic transport membrane protein
MGLLLGALMIHGVNAGPLLMSQHPDVFWGVITSMYVGNVALLLLNLPFIGMWVKILKVPHRMLIPLIVLCCLIGAYATNNNAVDIIVMGFFGMAGYFLRKLGYELAPLILALVLGPVLETNFRNSLILSDGRLAIFFERPISAVLLVISVLLLISAGFSAYRKTKTTMEEKTGGGD